MAAAALAAADRVVQRWLPGGKREGHEWKALNPTRSDARRGSFSVNLQTGKWADFASDHRGGDFVALVAMIDRCGMGEACDRLAGFLGLPAAPPAADRAHGIRSTAAAAAAPAAKPQVKNADAAEPLAPVPDDAPPPPEAHPRQGKPAATWDYLDASGRLLLRVARFDRADGGKEIMPLTLWREGDRTAWRWRALPAPRPLYGLDRLAARPAAPVLVVEGEKAAEAAGRLLPDWVITTSSGGAKAAARTDWTPLRGRSVVLWADADAAGAAYVEEVSRLALAAGCASVAVLRLDALAALRGAGELPAGWDAFDAAAEGLDLAALAGLLADPAALGPRQPPPAPKPGRQPAPRSEGRSGPRAPFLCVEPFDGAGRRAGVYYVPTVRDRQTGELVEGAPEWICSPLKIEALTRDHAGAEWGRLLAFPDRDGTQHRWAMPLSVLARDGAEMRETLLAMGLEITADAHRRRRLAEYIQAAEPGRFARCVSRAGWHGDAFVMPARTVGAAAGEALVFQTAAPGDHKLAEAGELADWREHVSAPCAGNSRLVVALSAAFAAPCLHLAGLEGGGLHFRGASSSGKSTALALAASVYGPAEYRREWRATDNALESVAALHCDALLALDEIGQLDPKHAAAVAYLLSNGQGKSRSRRDGSLRAPATWRLLFLSSGEVGLCDLIAATGGKSRAGMEVRVVDVPADAGGGLGIFERLPDGLSPGAFADRLKSAAAKHYGGGFPAFLRGLVGDLDSARKFLRLKVDRLAAEMAGDDAAGQVRRVAQRLALIGAAGELASAFELTGWPTGEAEAAARRCFNDWLNARGGTGEAEPRQMLAQVQHFVSLHSEGRFAPMSRADDDRAPKTLMRAGWRVDAVEGLEHWVLPEVWRREVCAGFDPTEVARALAGRGLLKPEGRGFTRRERIKGTGESVRVVRLLPGLLEVDP